MNDKAIKDAVREAHRVIRDVDAPLGAVAIEPEVASVRALIAALHERGLDDLARAIEAHEDGIADSLREEHDR